MPLRLAAAGLLPLLAAGQQAGTVTPEKHPALSIQTCTGGGGCTAEAKSVTVDANWRWLRHDVPNTYDNCFKDGEFVSTYCSDEKACAENCALEGADYEKEYGVTASGAELTLKYIAPGGNAASRLYLMNGEDKYFMFKLKNKEFAFDVDVTTLDCGLNGALYLVQMDEDGGLGKGANKAGAKFGTGYCDAQCPSDIKFIEGSANFGGHGTCCVEMDLWEANKMATAFTPHSCKISKATRCEGADCGPGTKGADRYGGFCDSDGCDFHTYRLGKKDFYGPGSSFAVDSTKPFTVVTQFITEGNTDSGKLKEVKQFFVQGGQTIEAPTLTLNSNKYDSVTPEFCHDEISGTYNASKAAFLSKGGFDSMDDAMGKGMVLALSIWDDGATHMQWLDGVNNDGSAPGDVRGKCPYAGSDPKVLRANSKDAFVKYYNIRIGDLGSTTGAGYTPGAAAPPSSSSSPGGSPGSSSAGGDCAGSWQQCGGKDFNGGQEKCCSGGATCQGGEWYKQCTP